MTRSYRKTPIVGMTIAKSDKAFKQSEHRRARAIERTALRTESEEQLHHKATGNPWKSKKDGKQWVGPKRLPKLIRK